MVCELVSIQRCHQYFIYLPKQCFAEELMVCKHWFPCIQRCYHDCMYYQTEVWQKNNNWSLTHNDVVYILRIKPRFTRTTCHKPMSSITYLFTKTKFGRRRIVCKLVSINRCHHDFMYLSNRGLAEEQPWPTLISIRRCHQYFIY